MTYRETLDYLYRNLPMFQRVGASAFKKDLINTRLLCNALGNPQNTFKSIHIAGTNGKGSTSHMLAAVLQTSGYKTGLYTSPHLKEFTERIRVNGHEVSQGFVMNFVDRVKPLIDEIKPSFFEITVAMAFDYFAQEKVDVAVIETGLGGRLDSTNIISPCLSVITNISWDHMDLLGNTLPQIASEKAGIIKTHTPVIVSERQSEVESVFVDQAKASGSEIKFASDHIQVDKADSGWEVQHHGQKKIYPLDLFGAYQKKNLPGVLMAIEVLRSQGFTLPEPAVAEGLAHAARITGLKGRWQKLSDRPLTICDTGHNEAGILEILNQLKGLRYNRLHWVWGMVKDKDVKVLHLLPKDAHYYFCQAAIPRAMPVEELYQKATTAGLTGEPVPNVNDALKLAMARSTSDDVILIGGSTFVVAELDNL